MPILRWALMWAPNFIYSVSDSRDLWVFVFARLAYLHQLFRLNDPETECGSTG